MWLTNVSIRRPIFIIMFVLALIVLGWQSRSKMPAELNPRIDFPFVTVITVYPGAGPNEMETLVTEPIEKAVGSIGNLRSVTSSSQDSVSSVMLEFELGTDLDAAAADVRDKVSAIKRELPDDVEEPSILKLDISADPIMIIGLSGPLTAKEMRILADDVVTDRLAKVGGVASVNVSGGEEREVAVSVDKDRLQAYGVGLGEIVQSIKMGNLNLPAGSIKEGARDYSVRTVGEYESAEQIANVRINVPGKNGKPDFIVRLGDIADINDSVKEADTITRLNGEPGVVITVQKQSDANTVDVCEGIREQLEELETILPSGVEPIIAQDQSEFVEDSLKDVSKSLYEGIFLVVVIVFLFLHTARATFIVAIAIPTSIMATYTPIAAFGFTMNQMTLLALALVVGILVDDSIVVLENIERHLRMREKPDDAALKGRSEIGLAAITITFVDIVVFIPIAFMGGIVGQFFKQFGVTVAVATAFSLLMSFTLTPMLASRWMKSEDEKDRDENDMLSRLQSGAANFKDKINAFTGRIFGGLDRFLKGLDFKYRGVLEWALHNRFLISIIGFVSLLVVFAMAMPPKGPSRVVIAAIAILLSAIAFKVNRGGRKVATIFAICMAVIALFIYLPFGFNMFPEVDRGNFAVDIRTAPGTSLVATDAVVRQVEEVITQLPEIKGGYYMSFIGTASSGGRLGGSNTGPQYARIDAKVVDKDKRERTIQEIKDWVAERVANIPGAERISVAVSSGMGGPSGGIYKEIQGSRMEDILAEADMVAKVVAETPGAVDVDISYKESRPERRIIVDRIRAAEYGMSVTEVASAARIAIDGDDSAKLRDEGTEYPIRVRYAGFQRQQAADVENLIVGQKDGSPIYLRDVAEVRYDYAPTKIDRKNRQRVVYVTANIASNASLGNISQIINQKLAKMEHVHGTSIGTGGMEQIMGESFAYMLSAFMLSIVLVYMLMGALFESFLTPFVIMFSLPQAMVGALLALLVTGKTLSIVAMIGIIMLMGLVAKNAILLVDYTNTLRSRGKNRHDALLEAGPTRLRPILMTTLAMVGGMMPTAIAVSKGAEIRAPMAIAVIGGLILSTMLTLIVIPVVYTIVEDVWYWFLRTFSPGRYQRIIENEEHVFGMEAAPASSEEVEV